MDLVQTIAEDVASLARERARVLVAIDGPDTAGKTTLADNLVKALDVPSLRASIDGFHRPRESRVRRGALSPVGYFRDSFDYAGLADLLLVPFRTGANEVRVKTFDWRSNLPIEQDPTLIPERMVLVFDGVFLLRREIQALWDLSVYLRVSDSVVLSRALTRDVGLVGAPEEVRKRYETRYLPGQALYRSECDPESVAHVVVDNSDFADPIVIRRWTRPATGTAPG